MLHQGSVIWHELQEKGQPIWAKMQGTVCMVWPVISCQTWSLTPSSKIINQQNEWRGIDGWCQFCEPKKLHAFKNWEQTFSSPLTMQFEIAMVCFFWSPVSFLEVNQILKKGAVFKLHSLFHLLCYIFPLTEDCWYVQCILQRTGKLNTHLL